MSASRQFEHASDAGTAKVRYITHPEVVQDPNTPVPKWALSEVGRARINSCIGPWLAGVAAIWASEEAKAREAGAILAASRGITVNHLAALGEIDRSSTGYLSPAEHAQNTRTFYEQPTVAARGWEAAVTAQARMFAAVDRVLGASPPGDIVIVAHGAVGTLLLCALKGIPISQTEDQPGMGHAFSFSRNTREMIHGWIPLESIPSRAS